jgi:hypothetical protein
MDFGREIQNLIFIFCSDNPLKYHNKKFWFNLVFAHNEIY